ncbi:OmpP1/FadL family transporter [Gynuella sunshinyii]|uniref:Long-chain fatty acid transport protein n=1 Tax=Gynuella sunshinyii YC6258 TaxID=1445510 RepID=A0A0C5UYT3_9GAMM|nr:outer membrane protein transport protein [Gynuella sunshinyii]AJQ92485.1 long-chain fatty acid transport protein [Gynuella sunshinyii YC6258]
MSKFTKRLPLAAAISALASTTIAGGFDNSGQPFDIILGTGNEITIMTYSTTVELTGKANSNSIVGGSYNSADVKLDDVASDYMSLQVGARLAITDSIACAFQTDEPYKTHTKIADESLSYFDGASGANAKEDEEHTPIETEVTSNAWTVACGYGIQMGKSRLTFFAGPKFQNIHAVFSSDMMNDLAAASVPGGLATGENDNISYDMGTSYEAGYVAGIGYEIKDIALKIGVFYHSPIDYTIKGTVTGGAGIQTLQNRVATDSVKADLSTPASWNLTLQTGIWPKWLVFGNLHWSAWSELDSLNVTSKTNSDGAGDNDYDVDLGLFSNDTLDYRFGVGHQVTDKLVMAASYSSTVKLGDEDLPDGVDSDSLRQPRGDSYTLSLGGRYALSDNFSLSAGLGYTNLDKTTVDNGSFTVVFDESEAWTYALGMTMTF